MTDQHIEQLRAEAAAHRQSIATDLELVGDRVSPSRIAERRKARLRERVYGMRDTVFGSADRSRSTGGLAQSQASRGTPAGGQSHQPYQSTQSSSGGDDGRSLGDRASGAVDAVREHTPDSLGEVTEGNPLAAGIVGFGIGMLAASLLPSSPDERRVAARMQGTLEDTAAELGRTGREAVENVKPEAQQAVADLKESAQGSVESVKSDAQSKVESVKDTAQTRADEVRSQA
jgi:gas vesicle protein